MWKQASRVFAGLHTCNSIAMVLLRDPLYTHPFDVEQSVHGMCIAPIAPQQCVTGSEKQAIQSRAGHQVVKLD